MLAEPIFDILLSSQCVYHIPNAEDAIVIDVEPYIEKDPSISEKRFGAVKVTYEVRLANDIPIHSVKGSWGVSQESCSGHK
jgi:hypothetical protein